MCIFKVLLIDDEPSVIYGLKTMIPWNEMGYEVCGSANNGEDGLNFIKGNSPDLVITDIKMPVFSGLELIKRAVNELKSKAKFVILSGYDDFSFAKEALKYNVKDYILKPIDEDEIIPLLRKLHKQMVDEITAVKERDMELEFIANETINRLLNGEKKDSLINRAKLVLDISENEWFRIALVEIEDFEDWMSGFDGEEVQKRKGNIIEIIKTALNTENIFYVYDDGLNRLVFFINEEMAGKKKFRNLVEDIKAAIRERYNITVSIFASGKHQGVESTEKAYKQALNTRNYRFFKGKGSIILYEDIKDAVISYTIMDALPVESLMEDLEANNLHNLTIKINTVFCEFYNKTIAPEIINAFINDLQFSIARLITAMNGNVEEFIKKEKIFSYDMNEITLNDLRKNVISFCENSSRYINSLRKKNSVNVINEIMEYINKNFQSNLSLKQIAAQFYMNPIYLGQLFKKITGMYFNDYLNVVRIEEAKKLLRRTNMKIYEIAAQVGYIDPDYFFSRFEKLNHISPLKYKKSIMNEDGADTP